MSKTFLKTVACFAKRKQSRFYYQFNTFEEMQAEQNRDIVEY